MKKIFTMLAVFFAMQASAQLSTHNWSHRMGGTNSDEATTIVTDNAGNSYTAGHFQGTFTVGTTTLTSLGSRDIFLIKRNSSGSVVFVKQFGGTGNDYCRNIKFDNFGSIYLVGDFTGTIDMDPNAGVTNLVSNGGSDVYVARLTLSGLLMWARSIGGTGTDYGSDVAVFNQGFAIEVAGAFSNTVDWDPSPAIANMISAGGLDGFVWNLSNSGNVLTAWGFGSTGNDIALGLEIDNTDRVVMTGSFAGTVDFNNGGAVLNLTANGSSDIFIGKFQANLAPIWVKNIGGSSMDIGRAVAIDANNDVYVAGIFRSTADFDPGPATSASSALSGQGNGFLLKLNNNGIYTWHKTVSSTGPSEAHNIAISPNGNVVLVGGYSGTFNLLGLNAISSVNTNAFFWTMGPAGNNTGIYSTNSTSGFSNVAYGVDFPTNNDVYFSGKVAGVVDLNLLSGTNSPSAFGNIDAFSMKYQFTSCTSTMGPITTATACGSYNSPTSSSVWSSTGTYFDTLLNAGGCDSILQYNLTITQPTSSTINPTACSSWVSPNNTTYTSSGTYTNVLTNSAGCDSMITINLTVNQPTTSTLNPTACDSWISPNNTTYTTSGTYTNVLTNSAGCDSTIMINLTISASPAPSIAFNGTDLSVANAYTTYEWKRNGTVITGATLASYTPTQNGNYEVTVSNADNCTGSDTYNLMNVSVSEHSIRVLSIYPNPTYAKIEIGTEASSIQIRNLQGALLLEATDTKTVDVENLANGIYMIYATHKGQQYFGKFVKQ